MPSPSSSPSGWGTQRPPRGWGFFGLYEYCERLQVGGEYSCRGDFMDFASLTNDSFRAASMLVGVCNLVFIFSVVCLLLFCFLKAATVLKICGVLQAIGCVCMALGCIIYPNGWDDEMVQRTCGKDADKYRVGKPATEGRVSQTEIHKISCYLEKASFTNGGFTDIRPINEKSVIDETVMVDNSSQQGDDIRL
uniref:Uncharacterized protein n=1 Tax=Magallana gigas TaxID=29159 RepID=A0A8W8M872_MAGGI